MAQIKGRAWALPAAVGIALAFSSCAVYEPAPAYPAYGYVYSPGYYVPGPTLYFRYDGRRHRHHPWRG
jgi:hypothetical protein